MRRGTPHGVGGMVTVIDSPVYTTGVGLVLYGMHHRDGERFGSGGRLGFVGGAVQRVREWFGSFFE